MPENSTTPPSHPEAAEADLVDQALPAQHGPENDAIVIQKLPVEASDADAVEQQTVLPADDEDEYPHDD